MRLARWLQTMMIWKLFLAQVFISTSAISVEDPKPSSVAQGNSATKMTQHQCKAQCQRFGMKGMGDEFKEITRPQDCVAKCEEIYKD
mmetsp:Transcript_16524/g.19752  ORF Transcript_16524/g.19752 Transcript_16524/m.19752 type:complete len:87 (-) Transcript_16524:66-326(-)